MRTKNGYIVFIPADDLGDGSFRISMNIWFKPDDKETLLEDIEEAFNAIRGIK